ncbi:serine/threonine-protein kinase [Dokdonella sp.]|uniref:serine/threonine-protein kinase n=1 Tax=Dokdonella sp. TaxID=2291710 RepID=UPI001AFCDCF4|nr:serine/threonine-protein kinase [Dokdonella sp.]MBO9662458.1 serine/threonine protein kinase [Dokdonella sp.]
MSDSAARWAELERWLDRALDVEPERRAEWIAAQPLAPQLRDALIRAVAHAEAPGDLDRLQREFAAGGTTDADWIGRRVGAFRIERLLGEGGSASVYLAEREQAGFRQRVALKLLRQGLFRADDRALFERERRILAALEHPHIARLIDGGVTDNGVPYIAMEYVDDGEPITAYCDRLRLPLARRIALFVEVCEVVAYAQRNLVVHRDLKPSNILVARDGTLKLLDFGIAKLLGADDDSARTATAMLRLTPGYAAPEQFAGGAITTATDVHALGVLLHELLTGERPRFGADGSASPSSVRVLGAAASARASTPAALARALRGDLDTVVRTSLAPEPSRRYADAAALGADLGRCLRGEPIAARPASAAYRARKFVARHPFGVPAAAIAALLLIAATAWSAHQTALARREAGRAERAAADATRQAAHAQAESRRALAIKQFLLDLFTGAAPAGAEHHETAADLLAYGERRANEDFTAYPEMRIELLQTIGRVRNARDEIEAAKAPLDAAVALARERFGAGDARTLAAESARTILDDSAGAYADGKRRIDAAIDAYAAAGGGDSAAFAQALAARGALAHWAAPYDPGIDDLRRAFAMLQRFAPDDARAWDSAQVVLVELLSRAGHNEQAVAEARGLLTRARALHGEDHVDTVHALQVLADPLRETGDLAGAEAALGEALAIERRIYAAPNLDIAQTLNDLGVLRGQRMDPEGGAALMREAYAILHRLAPDSPATLTTAGNLASVEARRGRYAQAEPLLRDVLAHQSAGPANAAAGATRRALAGVLLRLGRIGDAEAQWRAALAADRAMFGERHRAVGADHLGLARASLARKNTRCAVEADAARAIFDQTVIAVSPFRTEADVVAGKCAQLAGRTRQARTLLDAASDRAAHAEPVVETVLARVLADRADAELADRDAAAARASIEAADAALGRASAGNKSDVDYAEARDHLAALRARLRD